MSKVMNQALGRSERCTMARRNGNEPALATDKAKIYRVFFVEVEGNNESVQEALKTMVSAMNRPRACHR